MNLKTVHQQHVLPAVLEEQKSVASTECGVGARASRRSATNAGLTWACPRQQCELQAEQAKVQSHCCLMIQDHAHQTACCEMVSVWQWLQP